MANRLFRIACNLVEGKVGSPTLVASHFVQAEINRDDLAVLPVHLDCFAYVCSLEHGKDGCSATG